MKTNKLSLSAIALISLFTTANAQANAIQVNDKLTAVQKKVCKNVNGALNKSMLDINTRIHMKVNAQLFKNTDSIK